MVRALATPPKRRWRAVVAGLLTGLVVLPSSVALGLPLAAPAAASAVIGPRVDASHVLVIAHRGDSAVAPENTLPAMTAAARAGADLVEFDVQRTSDGHLVVVHDTTFARTTDVAQVFPGRADDPVGSFTLAEVRRLDAGSWLFPAYAGTRVPTLGAHPGDHTAHAHRPASRAQEPRALPRLRDAGGARPHPHRFRGLAPGPRPQLRHVGARGLPRRGAVRAGRAPNGVGHQRRQPGHVAEHPQRHHLDGDRRRRGAGDRPPPAGVRVAPGPDPGDGLRVERLVDDRVRGIITDDPGQTRSQLSAAGAEA